MVYFAINYILIEFLNDCTSSLCCTNVVSSESVWFFIVLLVAVWSSIWMAQIVYWPLKSNNKRNSNFFENAKGIMSFDWWGKFFNSFSCNKSFGFQAHFQLWPFYIQLGHYCQMFGTILFFYKKLSIYSNSKSKPLC